MSTVSKIIIGSAIFSAVVPLLGFPGSVKDGLVVILGLMIAGVTYWAEKHARFCPECNLPETTPHNHDTAQKQEDSSWAGATRLDLHTARQVPSNTSVGESPIPPSPRSDIVPRNAVEPSVSAHVSKTPVSAPSPFSFDVETEKPKKVSRGGRRKTIVVS